MRLRSFVLVTALLSALAAVPALASTIDLGINGDALVGPTYISFANFPADTAYNPAPGYGIMEVAQPPMGLFLTQGVTSGEFGTIESLDAATTIPGNMLSPTPGSSPAFMTFDTGGSNLKIYLTELLPGTSTGPFSLSDSQLPAVGATATFNIAGFVYNSTDQSRVGITGTFAATFNGMTVADLLSMEAAGKTITTPFIGTFTITTSPEPGSLFLLGAGLLGMGLISRRKKPRLSSS